MKTTKIILVAALLTAGLFTFSSCNSTRKTTAQKNMNTQKMTVPSTDLPHHSELQMAVIPAVYTGIPESVEVRLTNNTESLAQFGAEFVVEHYQGKKWKVVPGTEKFPVIMILYSLPAGESQTYKFHLRADAVKYEKGLYRLSKRMMLDNTTNYGVSAVFEIQ